MALYVYIKLIRFMAKGEGASAHRQCISASGFATTHSHLQDRGAAIGVVNACPCL